MTWTNYICQEKKEEEDTPALKIASIRRHKHYIKRQRKANYSEYKQSRDQQNNNDQKTEMWSITTVFKRQMSEISHEKTWTWPRKRNFKRETESLLIVAQNNDIRSNYAKAKIDKTQQNINCRVCGDRDETINHIISECSKLVQKEYKTKYEWVGKVIYWELCEKFKVDQTNQW